MFDILLLSSLSNVHVSAAHVGVGGDLVCPNASDITNVSDLCNISGASHFHGTLPLNQSSGC